MPTLSIGCHRHRRSQGADGAWRGGLDRQGGGHAVYEAEATGNRLSTRTAPLIQKYFTGTCNLSDR